jgi:glycosyltransferase involved in cell wall biosynthesis
MKILHLAENVSNDSGGIRTAVLSLNNYISKQITSEIICNHKELNDTFIQSKAIKLWSYSKELKLYLNKNLDNYDVAHLHGIFTHIHFAGSKYAQLHNKPYVLSPHGMLSPQLLKNKALKKSLYLNLIGNKIIKNASYLHAITPIEKEYLFKLTQHKNIIEIPNLINYSIIPDRIKKINNQDYFIYLGRLHPIKGLEMLINSMSKIKNKTIKLKIVGANNHEYANSLVRLVEKLNLKNRIEFVGEIFGTDKYNLLVNAKALIAPSFSEVIGMVNLEAAACKIPVITTFATGISPNWNKNGGIMINPNTQELVNAINTITNCQERELTEMGLRLSEYVFNEYSWEKKGNAWIELYQTMI